MRILISEVRTIFKLRLYMPGVITLFAIPDIAASVEFGYLPPHKRYPKWFDAFVDPSVRMPGSLAWMVRNALLHESAMNWRAGGFDWDRLIIDIPEPGVANVHGITCVHTNEDGSITPGRHIVLLPDLVDAILGGASAWLDQAEADVEKAARLNGMMQVRPQGLSPIYSGKPIIT